MRSDEPCGARKRDCNTLRGLVSNGNENIERFRKAARNWKPRFVLLPIAFALYLHKGAIPL